MFLETSSPEGFDSLSSDTLKHLNSAYLGLSGSALSSLEQSDLWGGNRLGASASSLDPLSVAASERSLETTDNIEQLNYSLIDNQAFISGIQGTKWNDLNGNGVKDTGEAGLAGWTIYLDQNNNGTLDTGETSTLTDANGNYSFTGLAAGTFTVAEVMQSGWQQTSPGAVTNGSFETGSLTGWNTIGSTEVQTASYGVTPTQGTYQAVLTNGSGSVTDSALESLPERWMAWVMAMPLKVRR
jgi:hypothetical protein